MKNKKHLLAKMTDPKRPKITIRRLQALLYLSLIINIEMVVLVCYLFFTL